MPPLLHGQQGLAPETVICYTNIPHEARELTRKFLFLLVS